MNEMSYNAQPFPNFFYPLAWLISGKLNSLFSSLSRRCCFSFYVDKTWRLVPYVCVLSSKMSSIRNCPSELTLMMQRKESNEEKKGAYKNTLDRCLTNTPAQNIVAFVYISSKLYVVKNNNFM